MGVATGLLGIAALGPVTLASPLLSDSNVPAVSIQSTSYNGMSSNVTVKTGLIYNGQAQTLVNPGKAYTGYTIKYKLGSNGTCSTTVPTAVNAGTYTVYYRILGDANHLTSAVYSVIVTISK